LAIEVTLVSTAAVAIGGAALSKPKRGETKIERLTKVTIGVAAYSFGLLIIDQRSPQVAQPMAALVLIALVLRYSAAITSFVKSTFLAEEVR